MTDNLKDRAQLYRKIAAVTAAIKRIPKSGENTYFHYRYALESDVTDGLRELLAEHGLAVLPPTVLAWERGEPDARGNFLTRVQYQFGIGDCETGETFESVWWAEAQDNADKSFAKTATSGLKYFLLKTFLVATGDDANDDPDHGPAELRQPNTVTTRPQATSAPLQRPTAASTGPRCPQHPQREPKVGRDGGLYCSAKQGDGWCTWKQDQPAPAPPSAEDIERARRRAAPRGSYPAVPATGGIEPDDLPFDMAPPPDEDARLAEAIEMVEGCEPEHLERLKGELRAETWSREQAAAIGTAFKARAQEATA